LPLCFTRSFIFLNSSITLADQNDNYYFAIFIGCIVAIYVAGELIVSSLGRIAKFLGWKEFVVAFS